MSKKYTIINPITIGSLQRAGACRDELIKFIGLAWLEHSETLPSSLVWVNSHHVDELINIASQCVGGIDFLIKHNFIAEVKETTYHPGQRFITGLASRQYILADVGQKTVALINIRTGCMRKWPVPVHDSSHITETELAQLSSDPIRLVEEKDYDRSED